ncbi:MAG: hypothetical protein JNM86_03755 [Phycisphaerae bacterium]|nr:hypothetical protein [Phycisphaerae bacterium]
MSDQAEPLDPQIELAPASWPKVLGIISIAWACLGLSCLVCGVGAQLAFGPNMLPEQFRDNPPPSMKFGMLQIIQTIFSLITSALLLAAGIQTTRRQFSGRTLHIVWGVISLIALVYGAYAAWHTQQETLVWARNNPDNPIAKQTLAAPAVGLVITAAIIGFFALYPVFILFWFGAVKRTKESFGAAPAADYI